jgi:hypothetical protein
MPASQPQTPHREQAAIPRAANPRPGAGPAAAAAASRDLPPCPLRPCRSGLGWLSGRPVSAADRAAATVADRSPPLPGCRRPSGRWTAATGARKPG